MCKAVLRNIGLYTQEQHNLKTTKPAVEKRITHGSLEIDLKYWDKAPWEFDAKDKRLLQIVSKQDSSDFLCNLVYATLVHELNSSSAVTF